LGRLHLFIDILMQMKESGSELLRPARMLQLHILLQLSIFCGLYCEYFLVNIADQPDIDQPTTGIEALDVGADYAEGLDQKAGNDYSGGRKGRNADHEPKITCDYHCSEMYGNCMVSWKKKWSGV
jgi:hypothetical protein